MTAERLGLWPGVPLALGSAILFGASTPFTKILLGEVHPWMMAGLLYLGAGAGLLAYQCLRGAFRFAPAGAPLRRGDLPWLLAALVAGGVAGPVLLMFGLSSIDAASASLLLNLEGLATMAIAWVVFRENVDRRLLVGAAAILVGAVLLAWPGEGPALSAGALLIAAACVAWGIDNNLTRKISGADSVQLAMMKGLVPGAVNLGIAVALGAGLPSAATIAAALAVGFLGYGVSLVFYVMGLRYLGAARTAAYFGIAPFVGAALAVYMFAEPVTAALIVSGLLMAIGVWLHATERHHHAHTHERMAHEHMHIHDSHHRHKHGPDAPPGEPHSHWHVHEKTTHTHPHYPDLHHRHGHGEKETGG